MTGISATIITYNEERDIAACLESLAWTDEIIVVDALSSDRTVAICREKGARVFERAWPGYAEQRNYALEKTRRRWVLTLDADERVSADLREEILRTLEADADRYAGYRMQSLSYYLGRWLRHGEWYPKYKVRLFDREKGRWEGRHVHERAVVEGRIGELKNPLIHYPYRDMREHIAKIRRYAALKALQDHEKGIRPSPMKLAAEPLKRFAGEYWTKRGYRDGIPGFVTAALDALYEFLRHAHLRSLESGERK